MRVILIHAIICLGGLLAGGAVSAATASSIVGPAETRPGKSGNDTE